MEKMGDILKILRIANDLSAKSLCEKMQISKNYISEIETCKKNVTLQLLKNYSETLNIPLSKIFEVEEQTRNSDSLYQEALLMFLKYYVYEKDALEENSNNYTDSDIKQPTKNRNN